MKALEHIFRHPGARLLARTRGPTPAIAIASADSAGDGPRIAFGVRGDGIGGLRRVVAILATLAFFFGAQSHACNTIGLAHLGSANTDRVVVRFQDRRPALEIKSGDRVGALASYFIDLGGAWRSTIVAPSALNGDIHFYRGDQSVESIWISPAALGRGGCYREFAPAEFAALVALLNVKRSDFEK